ncbi:MAG: hypothetical protein RBR73_04375 [Halothiobacillaceae bacterium]|jgi:antitoxin component of RelBE/YafQ-DinJ toxin-antitoxin module|nr:hypothetical protein [Halothiobacillaceae bacterium]
MKHGVYVAIGGLLMSLAAPVALADWKDGLAALEKRQFSQARSACIDDARRGDAVAQWIAGGASLALYLQDKTPAPSKAQMQEGCGLLGQAAEQGFPPALMQYGACLLFAKQGGLDEEDVVRMLAYKLAALKQLPEDAGIQEEIADTSAANDPALRASAQQMADAMAARFAPVSRWSDALHALKQREDAP